MASSHAQTPSLRHANDQALWPAAPVQLARGRQPRDAQAKTVPFTNITSFERFQSSVREYLSNPPEDPEHTDAQFSFWIGTRFSVPPPVSTTLSSQSQQPSQPPSQQQQPPSQQPQQQTSFPHHHAHAPSGYHSTPYGGLPQGQPLSDPTLAPRPSFAESIEPNNGPKKVELKVDLTVAEALQPTPDPKDRMRKQRAIAKCCVEAIQKIDGYRYSFHNCWNSREDDSFRFSYYCNDSLLNKDRAANGKGAKLGKRATKPVYDCKGVLSVKFSASKQTLDVFYKHVPLHKTYEERAPPPRKDSKRRKYLEENDPDALARFSSRSRQLSSEDPDGSKTKRKKSQPFPEPPRPSHTSLESDLRAQSLRSLLELIQVDPPSQIPTPPSVPPQPRPQPLPTLVRSAPEHPLAPQPMLHVETQPGQQSQRKRSRNSCDVCKAKKTKCDGTRPICQTCISKKRECFYPDSMAHEEQPPPVGLSKQVSRAEQAPDTESELERLKRELEEAKAKIREFETERRTSTTPVQAPQTTPRPQSQPQHIHTQPQQTHIQQQPRQMRPQAQARHRPQLSQSQTIPQLPQQQKQQTPQRQQTIPNHRQQLSQLNQGSSRVIGSPPQQLAYKLGSQSPQQRLQNLQPQQQQQQQLGPSPTPMTAQQQLQAHQIQSSQLRAPQNYFAANHSNHSPYGTLNRPLPQTAHAVNVMTNQTSLLTQNNAAQQTQAQQQPQDPNNQATPEMLSANAGMASSAQTIDPTNPFGRSEYAWPAAAAYYGYQGQNDAQQQQ
ncbi:hypothetical protein yc1106_09705 [Curvularia clavata]|uniref:Zn(2)-C6 fungal-type domain-containing protein n=1 Tax=Curvularia clavata TaxID=95742 RepID=A0A9Q9DYB9_CURCL|nr:hypothetical protein yc1106_09705 [Curvularia clavata]